MNTISLSLKEIYQLAKKTLLFNGRDEINAESVSRTVVNAERDGSISHGLFRIPGYVASLKSKKVNGKARPEIKKISSSVLKVFGNSARQHGRPVRVGEYIACILPQRPCFQLGQLLGSLHHL